MLSVELSQTCARRKPFAAATEKSLPLPVLVYDPFHLVELGLHIFDHLELRSTPVQVVVLPVRLEIDITIQVVSQKPDTAF
jgi:hypothetical protein